MPPQIQGLRILIVRLGAMGDVLHALPAVTALRTALDARLAGSWVGWAIEPQWAPLLRADSWSSDTARGSEMPVVDGLHLVDAKRWVRHPFSVSTISGVRDLRGALLASQYDICIDLQGAIRSALIGRMASAPRMVGEAHPREPLARWLFGERMETSGVHMIEQAHEVVAGAFGNPLASLPAALPIDPIAEAWCDAWLTERGIERFVLMNPGAGWGAKRWPAERYALVAAELAQMGYATIVNVGPGESALAKTVCGDGNARCFMMAGSIGQLIACTRRATLFLGGDTGPLHLAAALKIPVVGIYGPTDPARNGPYGTPSRVLRHPESRRDHSRKSEPEAGLMTITARDVLEAAHQLFGEKTGAR